MWFTLTLLLIAVVVVGLVVYLVAVALALINARRHVARIADALESSARDTVPLEEKLVTINGALSALADGLAEADRHLARTATVFRL